jgi:hypothetical protein
MSRKRGRTIRGRAVCFESCMHGSEEGAGKRVDRLSADTAPVPPSYFIPLFPTGRPQRYVECSSCAGTFKEEVLSLEEPSEGQKVIRRIFEEMQQGVSLEETEKRLLEVGLEPEQAREIVSEMAGKVWPCQTCGEHYVAGVKRCSRCRP